MLVLSRKQNQEIIIGDNIKITVLKMKGNTVRLGIEAPRDVNVLRGELPRNTEVASIVIAEEETPEQAPDEEEIDPASNFTVVFRNTNDTAQVDVIPFDGDSQTAAEAIKFQGKTPVLHQPNRLTEIAAKLMQRSRLADQSKV